MGCEICGLAADLGPVARHIHDKMSDNADTFVSPIIAMPDLLIVIKDYEAKLVARGSGATADVLALKVARKALEKSLGVLGMYVNGLAQGDPVIVEKSGFPIYDTRRTPDFSPPAAPENLRLARGGLSGTLVARYKPARPGSTNEVQANTGDPNNENDWHRVSLYRGSKAEMSGFEPGSLVWIRVRTVGLRGVMGAWSDPAQIRVL